MDLAKTAAKIRRELRELQREESRLVKSLESLNEVKRRGLFLYASEQFGEDSGSVTLDIPSRLWADPGSENPAEGQENWKLMAKPVVDRTSFEKSVQQIESHACP